MKKIDIEKKMHGKLNYVIDFLYNIYIYTLYNYITLHYITVH